MAAAKRLRQVMGEFNIGISTIVDFLAKKGIEIDSSPNTKLSPDVYEMLASEFAASKSEKIASEKLAKERKSRKNVTIEASMSDSEDDDLAVTVNTKIEERPAAKTVEETPAPVAEQEKPAAVEPEPVKEEKIATGLKVMGKIDLEEKPKAKKKTAKKAAPVSKKEAPVDKEEAPVSKKEETSSKEETPVVEEVVAKKEEKEISVEKPAAEKPEKNEAPAANASSSEESGKGPKVLGKLDDKMLNATNRPKKTKKKPLKKQQNATSEEKTEAVKEDKKQEKQKPQKPQEVESPIEKAEEPAKEQKEEDINVVKTKFEKLSGPKVLGKMQLPEKKKPAKKKPVGSSSDSNTSKRRRKRKRIQKDQVVSKVPQKPTQGNTSNKNKTRKKKVVAKPEISDEDIQKQIKETLARLSNKKKSTSVKHRRQKRDKVSAEHQEELERIQQEQKVLKVTEFVSANDLANMMSVNVNEIIATCMSLGLFVSINQRLDAETLVIVAEEFGYEVKFVDAEVLSEEGEVDEEDLLPDTDPRTPIVTVMGHVDHGKTSLLDYIRSANVIAGEAGGITQHIGAYEVELEAGKKITFLDTPGHEAFTAMRARGSKVTDIAVIVVAADDAIMPQTKEAINHAQAADVPIIFAINKIDKPGANPEKIKEQLAAMNLLVEDWGGKIQSQDISAKNGTNINELMEKIVLEAEMLDLKSNPDRRSYGTVLESFLDKGKGYVANILVQNGTLKVGDVILAGTTWGKVKAMYNERNHRIQEAGPAQPALILGLNSAPIAGDAFKGMKDEHEAKNIANKREQLQREQSVHARKHITLDEIGRRLAIGDFQELNIIVKGDVDGSVEALSDSLEKLSNEEIQVNIIHKSVGQINEADVILASASDAIIVGFQVRPSLAARKLAENEGTDIRLYSVIYKAIDEIKMAIQGMLAPTMVEEIVCNIEVRDTFKITKVGTIAGCYVLDGKIHRNDKIRVIRDGIVIYTGLLGSLKRFKDDAKEVTKGFECGLNIEKFNDIKVGDIIEGYKIVEVERTV